MNNKMRKKKNRIGTMFYIINYDKKRIFGIVIGDGVVVWLNDIYVGKFVSYRNWPTCWIIINKDYCKYER